MRNPIALSRIAGLTLALSLAAGCRVSTKSKSVTPLPRGVMPAESAGRSAPGAAQEPTPSAADMVSTWQKGGTIPSDMAGVPDVRILEVIRNGRGLVCGFNKSATVKYKAMLENGTVKDPGTNPYTFTVGTGRVIAGWHTIVSKMRVGDSLIVLIPEGLAYPGEGNWRFEMELLAVR